MEYLDTSDDFIWYEGKKLSDKTRPEVFISSKSKQKAKNIVFKCRLPSYSDVYLSLKESDGSAQLKFVTVSAYHIKLNFMPLDDVVYNLHKIKKEQDLNSTQSSKLWYLNTKQRATIDYHIIFYDKKCRKCFYNLGNSTTDSSSGFLNPKLKNSIKCFVKVIFCSMYKQDCL